MNRRVVIALSLSLVVGATGSPALAASSEAPTWTRVGSYQPPIKRYGQSMARDVTGRTVMFGGLTTGTLGAEADTWRWNGSRWIRLQPPTSPPERSFAAMAYDPVRKETVLFGGYGGTDPTGKLSDTWVWDGERWTQRTSQVSPPGRSGGEMAWDPAGQKLILFGGNGPGEVLLADTWSWDGTAWALEPAVASPPPRTMFGFADGGPSSKPVLFGGMGDGANEVFLPDTWTWDGALHTWLPIPSLGPSGRAGSQMAYDPVRRTVVLHGGYARPTGNPLGEEQYADTWTFDGTAWTQRTPARSPWFTTRWQSALAWDEVDQRVRLFGGISCTPTPNLGCLGNYANDTWAWDGTTWAQEDLTAPNEIQKPMFARDPLLAREELPGAVMFGGQYEYGHYSQETWRWDGAEWEALSPEHMPKPRGMAAMTYVPSTDTTIMFGGQIDTLGLGGTREVSEGDDTWSWDGTDWTQLAPESSPPPRSHAMIAYDPGRDEVVLFGGGFSGFAKDDTWVWDGTDWTERHPASSPPARIAGSMAYDPARGEVVLFGGMMSKNEGYHEDTWVWNGEDWTEILAPGGSPPARAFGGMGWDPTTETVVYFGGCSDCYANPTYDETWSWDGGRWTQLTTATTPSRRTSFAMLSGDEFGPLLMFGGRRAVLTPEGALAAYPEGTDHTNDVWEFGS